MLVDLDLSEIGELWFCVKKQPFSKYRELLLTKLDDLYKKRIDEIDEERKAKKCQKN